MEITPNRSIAGKPLTSTAPMTMEEIAFNPDNTKMSDFMGRSMKNSLSINVNMLEEIKGQPILGDGKFSVAREMGELDLNTDIDSIGSPMELIEKVTEQMETLGRTALLTQTNQLPPVALPLGE